MWTSPALSSSHVYLLPQSLWSDRKLIFVCEELNKSILCLETNWTSSWNPPFLLRRHCCVITAWLPWRRVMTVSNVYSVVSCFSGSCVPGFSQSVVVFLQTTVWWFELQTPFSVFTTLLNLCQCGFCVVWKWSQHDAGGYNITNSCEMSCKQKATAQQRIPSLTNSYCHIMFFNFFLSIESF